MRLTLRDGNCVEAAVVGSRLAAAFMVTLPEAKDWAMANALWAAAEGGWWNQAFVTEVIEAFCQKLGEARPGYCSQLLLAAAKCQARHPMLQAVVVRLAETAGDADAFSGCNVLWAVARLQLVCQG